MKGLLLKDWYMTKKYCRSYLFITVLFFAFYLFEPNNTFCLVYPCVFASMIPSTLFGYDEKARWLEYCGTLPVKKEQIVSVKYIYLLIIVVVMSALTVIVQLIQMSMAGEVVVSEIFETIDAELIASAVVSCISLPMMFKLGVEKARVVYYIMIGLSIAVLMVVTSISAYEPELAETVNVDLIAILATIVLYAVSWYLSIAFYKKREI